LRVRRRTARAAGFTLVELALVFAITIIGLPLAAQHLKMTRLALLPFGFEVRARF